ncbi:hypothetical protein [Nostoc sp.]
MAFHPQVGVGDCGRGSGCDRPIPNALKIDWRFWGFGSHEGYLVVTSLFGSHED